MLAILAQRDARAAAIGERLVDRCVQHHQIDPFSKEPVHGAPPLARPGGPGLLPHGRQRLGRDAALAGQMRGRRRLANVDQMFGLGRRARAAIPIFAHRHIGAPLCLNPVGKGRRVGSGGFGEIGEPARLGRAGQCAIMAVGHGISNRAPPVGQKKLRPHAATHRIARECRQPGQRIIAPPRRKIRDQAGTGVLHPRLPAIGQRHGHGGGARRSGGKATEMPRSKARDRRRIELVHLKPPAFRRGGHGHPPGQRPAKAQHPPSATGRSPIQQVILAQPVGQQPDGRDIRPRQRGLHWGIAHAGAEPGLALEPVNLRHRPQPQLAQCQRRGDTGEAHRPARGGRRGQRIAVDRRTNPGVRPPAPLHLSLSVKQLNRAETAIDRQGQRAGCDRLREGKADIGRAGAAGRQSRCAIIAAIGQQIGIGNPAYLHSGLHFLLAIQRQGDHRDLSPDGRQRASGADSNILKRSCDARQRGQPHRACARRDDGFAPYQLLHRLFGADIRAAADAPAAAGLRAQAQPQPGRLPHRDQNRLRPFARAKADAPLGELRHGWRQKADVEDKGPAKTDPLHPSQIGANALFADIAIDPLPEHQRTRLGRGRCKACDPGIAVITSLSIDAPAGQHQAQHSGAAKTSQTPCPAHADPSRLPHHCAGCWRNCPK